MRYHIVKQQQGVTLILVQAELQVCLSVKRTFGERWRVCPVLLLVMSRRSILFPFTFPHLLTRKKKFKIRLRAVRLSVSLSPNPCLRVRWVRNLTVWYLLLSFNLVWVEISPSSIRTRSELRIHLSYKEYFLR